MTQILSHITLLQLYKSNPVDKHLPISNQFFLWKRDGAKKQRKKERKEGRYNNKDFGQRRQSCAKSSAKWRDKKSKAYSSKCWHKAANAVTLNFKYISALDCTWSHTQLEHFVCYVTQCIFFVFAEELQLSSIIRLFFCVWFINVFCSV